MFVVYMSCPARPEQYGNPAAGNHDAAYLIAADDVRELNELDYMLSGSECLWIVPGTADCLL